MVSREGAERVSEFIRHAREYIKFMSSDVCRCFRSLIERMLAQAAKKIYLPLLDTVGPGLFADLVNEVVEKFGENAAYPLSSVWGYYRLSFLTGDDRYCAEVVYSIAKALVKLGMLICGREVPESRWLKSLERELSSIEEDLRNVARYCEVPEHVLKHHFERLSLAVLSRDVDRYVREAEEFLRVIEDELRRKI